MVSHKGSTLHTTQKTHKKTNGKNTGGREALKSRVRGPGRSPPGEDKNRVVPGVATLERSPDQSPGVRPISPNH